MPELPEVEIVRESLNRELTGLCIEFVTSENDTVQPDESTMAWLRLCAVGRRFEHIRRRGKYLIWDLDDGSSLLAHLRMTGQLLVRASDAEAVRFERLRFGLSNQQVLIYADQRRFGGVTPTNPAELELLDGRLGAEPLEDVFSVAYLTNALEGRSGKIKSIILDQSVIAGLGNIYADEALFLARLHPHRTANSLNGKETAALHAAIREVLVSALGYRGTTFASFVDGYGQPGENRQHLRVYGRGRSGAQCERCGMTLMCIDTGGRSSHFCPNCQQLPPGD